MATIFLPGGPVKGSTKAAENCLRIDTELWCWEGRVAVNDKVVGNIRCNNIWCLRGMEDEGAKCKAGGCLPEDEFD